MIEIKQKNLRNFNIFHFILTLLLAAVGMLFVFSATYVQSKPLSPFLIKQAIGIITGIGIYFVMYWIDYRTALRWGYIGFFGAIALLLFTLIKGSIGLGAQRWLSLGFIRIQPSELTKVLFPIYATYHLYFHRNFKIKKSKQFGPILCMLMITVVLILKQPDLGTALLLLFTGLLMCWFAGIGKTFFWYGLFLSLLVTPFFWRTLQPYQKKRVLVFLGYGETQHDRYQIEQAKIAIGSGGLRGKGLLKGTQNKFRFLPEGRTDFIFAVIAEELGLIGTLVVLGLFSFLFLHILMQLMYLENVYLQLLGIGLIAPIMLSTFINMLMVLNMLPIVGTPLPLISYGISNLWVTLASLGLLQNISICQ